MPHPLRENETITIVSFASQNPERQAELRSGVQRVIKDRPYELTFPCDETEALQALPEAEILLTWGSRFTERVLQAATKLRWVHIGDAGVERCLFPAMVASDAVLTNSSGIHVQYMSEWALAMLFYISQGLSEGEAWKHDRDWKLHKDAFIHRRFLLEGKRALIVGYGQIGRAVAQKLLALGVKCEGIVSRFRPAGIALHTIRKLPEIIRYFDIVVIALPFTPATENLFNRDLLQSMKPGSALLNLARGKVVDEAALIEVLQYGPLSHAALDVFAREPLPPDSPLFSLSNLVMTPHISGNFPEYTEAVQELFLANLERYLAGQALNNVVDKVRGY